MWFPRGEVGFLSTIFLAKDSWVAESGTDGSCLRPDDDPDDAAARDLEDEDDIPFSSCGVV